MKMLSPISYLWPYRLTFVDKKHEAGDIYTFTFRPGQSLSWKAGQYIDYRLGFGLIKHFTIAAAPGEGLLKITTRIFEKPSRFKARLLELKKGDVVRARNIRGGLYISNPSKRHLFIAGGIGITPYRAIIWDMLNTKSNAEIDLLYLNSTDKIPFKKQLDQIAKSSPGIRVNYYIGEHKLSSDVLKKYVSPDTEYFVSGPPAMVENYVRILRRLKVPYRNIKSDPFLGY